MERLSGITYPPAMSLILDGVSFPTPFHSTSWLEDTHFRIDANDRAMRPTGMWVRGITLHTTHGKYPQPLKPGLGKGGSALANLQYWNRSADYASAHLLVDRDGVIYQTADLVTEGTWHATTVNPVTIGVEICQGSDGSLYQGQIDTVVAMCDWLTATLGIQRQIPQNYENKPITRLVAGARDFVGIFGHRDQSANRGRGDPGDIVMSALHAAGYEQFNLTQNEDLIAWKKRQSDLGLVPDGVPGKRTVASLLSAGHKDGLWVQRP